jgi:hypothetical protein
MTQKYIALFAGNNESNEAVEDEERQLALPPHFHTKSPSTEDQPSVTRLELLTKLKGVMDDPTEAGKQGVSLRPEETLKEDAAGRANKSLLRTDTRQGDSQEGSVSQSVDKDEDGEEEADEFFE